LANHIEHFAPLCKGIDFFWLHFQESQHHDPHVQRNSPRQVNAYARKLLDALLRGLVDWPLQT
jgi:hypothetical protein